jgi:DNA-binding CsgD family transcriptional regulator
MLAERRHPAAEVAVHLLDVEPRGDPWVSATLREAARAAARARDFAGAERLLSRALIERVDIEHAELLAELGSVEARAGNPDGIAHLRAAADATGDAVRGGQVSIELAAALRASMKVDQAADVLLDAIRRLDMPSSALGRQLQAELLATRFIAPAVGERINHELASLAAPTGAPHDLLDALAASAAAYDAGADLRPAREVVELGRHALSATFRDEEAAAGQPLVTAAVALVWAEDFDYVHEMCTRGLAAAQAISSAVAVGTYSTIRAICGYRAGQLLEAESDAATVLELAAEASRLRTLLPAAVAYAVVSGLERGRPLEELDDLAFEPSLDGARQLLPYIQLSWARGELYLCREQWERAVVHFGDCDRREATFGANNPSMLPWREGAALAHLRLGERGTARRLAADAVDRATRFGAPRALGVALRAAALAEEGEARIAGLEKAAAELGAAKAALELARVRCDLGAMLRAAGRRRDAQAQLEQAYALANGIGAVRIAERAAEELAAAGVRPRREPASGLAALTPSERRVAELAAAGKTNREIAETLFVTQKTVETHLGHVYDKLGVRSRHKLANRLGTETE